MGWIAGLCSGDVAGSGHILSVCYVQTVGDIRTVGGHFTLRLLQTFCFGRCNEAAARGIWYRRGGVRDAAISTSAKQETCHPVDSVATHCDVDRRSTRHYIPTSSHR